MSNSYIPIETKRQLWFNAVGRCEICCEKLDQNKVTKKYNNCEEIAHIIADSKDGPRGNIELSSKLKSELTNLLLVCPTCHRHLDNDLIYYTQNRLKKIKIDREKSIIRAIEMINNPRAHIIQYSARIDEHQKVFDYNNLIAAFEDSWFPAEDFPIDLNPSHTALKDNNKSFWESEYQQLEAKYLEEIRPRINRNELNNILLFAIAPQPLLIRLGILFRDLHDVKVFQKHKEPDSWKWENEPRNYSYSIIQPNKKTDTVILNLSLSANIDKNRISKTLGDDVSIWTVTHENPNNDYLRSCYQLEELRKIYRLVLRDIKDFHGQQTILHVFPACPASAAIEFGRVWTPKSDVSLRIYDQNKVLNSFEMIYEIN